MNLRKLAFKTCLTLMILTLVFCSSNKKVAADCPEPNLEQTVIIDGCDSEVANFIFDDGCTMNDRIMECSDTAKNHGKFVSCVSHLTNDWKKGGLISGKDKGAIQSCAAQSNLPYDSCDCPTYPVPVHRTGQLICYDNLGNTIDCIGTGQDGEYQMGVPSPNPRFTDKENGTVTDNLTGLMWLQEVDLLGGMIWIAAVDMCNDLVFAGYDDWRLPNGKEILTLTDYSQYAPRLPEGHPFIVDTSRNWVWTSTTCHERPYRAETMSLQFGDIGSEPKTYEYKCWCVRGGQ